MQTQEKSAASYIAKVLKRLLDIAWYLAIAGVSGIFIVFFVLVLTGSDNDQLDNYWPVEVGQADMQLSVPPATEANYRAKVVVNKGELRFFSDSAVLYLLKFSTLLLGGGVLLAIIYLLRAIFSDLSRNQPFTLENARRLRYMGWIFLLLLPVRLLLLLLFHGYIQDATKAAGFELQAWKPFFTQPIAEGQLRLAPVFDLQDLLFGLLLLVIAEVFRQGVLLKTENEAFV